MRITMLLLCATLLATACTKKNEVAPEPPLPEMTYRDYNDLRAGQQQSVAIDINNDGTKDIAFGFQLVGDPITQTDKHQFFVNGGFYTYFPVSNNERIPALQKGDRISANQFAGYNWYNASWILLAEKIVSSAQPDVWQGPWKNATHHYFPLMVLKGNDQYYGWFEISFDTTTQKIILHRSAVAKVAGAAIKAGY